ncbi:hypothetical protein P3L51_35380 [Streptomyces sp. PSRA5]|uniref:hypothetical protein n=1 Tax=Streptomyces panacea TaxID=3035064 RepID=UPI00339C006A
MADSAGFSASGWGNRELDLPPQDGTRPTVLEFRGGWFTSQYNLHELRREEGQEVVGPYLAAAMGLGRERVVLPAGCDRLRVRRFTTHGNSMAIGPWRLRTVPLRELTPLGVAVKGKHGDLLLHTGRRIELRFEWDGDFGGALFFQSLTEKKERQLTRGEALRGTVKVPTEGLLRVQGHGRWRLDVVSDQS